MEFVFVIPGFVTKNFTRGNRIQPGTALAKRTRVNLNHCHTLDMPNRWQVLSAGKRMQKRTKYQERIIKNYYQNIDAISLQRLSEHITELYLEECKARERRWKHIVNALEKLEIPADKIARLKANDSPAELAELVQKLMSGK